MLIEFSIENFRSIKDKVTFSLVASRSDRSLQDNLILGETALAENKTKKNALGKGTNLLKSAVLYGANASGKTNVLLSLESIIDIIMSSVNNMPGDKIKIQPFKLDRKCLSQPCTFDIDFIHNGIRYNYGASFTSEEVKKEYLYYYPKGLRALIFDRDIKYLDRNVKNPSAFRYGIDSGQQKRISNETNDNVFYLSNSAQRKYEKTSIVVMWLKTQINFLDRVDPPLTIQLIEDNLVSTEEIISMLKKADLAFSRLNIESDAIPYEQLPSEIKNQFAFDEKKPIRKVSMTIFHTGIDEDGKAIEVPFTMDEESGGTLKFFSLLGPWFDTIKSGSILFVDELDSKLHPLLCEYLVKLFNNSELNTKNAQLIFTTHNANLLNPKLKLLRRDQIWFTNKDSVTKSTELYSLLEFKQRKNNDFESAYLKGRYNAIPYIEDLGEENYA